MFVSRPWAALLAALFLALPLQAAGAQSAASTPTQKAAPAGAEQAPAAAPAAAPEVPVPPAKPAFTPDPDIQAAREKMEANRAALDALEPALQVEGLRSADLDTLRERLDPVRRELLTRSDELGARLTEVKARLAELGAKPAEGAPPEDPALALDRDRRQFLAGEVEGALKQNLALAARAQQIQDRISTRRRALFTDQLFERSISVLDPALWSAAVTGIASEWRSVNLLAGDWAAFASRRQEMWVLAGLALGLAAVVGLVVGIGRFARRRLRTPPPPVGEHFTPLRSAREALKVFALEALVAPAAILAASALLDAFDVVPPRVHELLLGLTIAVSIKAIGTGVGRALLAPDEPWRRMQPLSDRVATLVYRYYSLAVWTLSIAAFLHATHRALIAPVAVTAATSAVMALLIGAFIARFLVASSAGEGEEEAPAAGEHGATGAPAAPERLSWVRFLSWLVVGLVAAALVTGYVSFAAFVAARVVVAVAVLGGLSVLYGLIDAFFTEGLAAGMPRARALSKMLGLRQQSLELAGILIAGLAKVILFVLAAFIIIGSWGSSTADLLETVERASFGLRIGTATITLWSVLSALLVLLIGLGIARGLQRWISSAILPRTGLEPSLQSSIATILGYVGVIIVIMATIGELGINLESIAIVAGALSVGIGFGLQSIVSNFVSGLILLAERPIRVGDTIAVKGEEGYVRRISVRSTEIETFERAAVIVPNTDLITGMVKNWTHTNTSGRIIITVTVAYDADPEEVRDILVSCACDHPQVLQTPPPRVFLSRFSEMGIVFELRCVVANVDYSLTVKSDLHFQILSRFRKAGINMASQPWASMGRAPSDLVPLPPPKSSPPSPPSPEGA